MVFQGSSAALSHTGKVRANNQDSGYAGSNLFVVADGMGGHAGGDVASSLAIARIEALDQPFAST
ncbi:MAG: serine/threonine-protein phosphatase, partial [Microbacterium sp.]|nr:serine/threonine-protein phosphatase [Microbacterium sp.]